MVKSCAAFACTERYSKNSLISFHRFPNDKELRQKWIIATKRDKFNPSKNTVLCSNHFMMEDFKIYFGKRQLKEDAVPSIFDFPQHLLNKKKKRKYVDRSSTVPLSTIISSASTTSRSTLITTCHKPRIHEKKMTTKRIRCKYFGDFNETHLYSQSDAKMMFQAATNKILLQKKKIKILRMRNYRLSKQVKTLRNLLEHLKETNKISNDCLSLLQDTIPESEKELLLRQLKLSTAKKFPPQLRSFALTLNFYSTSAYNYVRKTFNNCLPHPSTIRKWLSSVDGSPGYTGESLRAIKLKVAELRDKNQELICGLIMDEMAIKKHIHWNGNRYLGFVDFGTNLDSDALPEAKEALVFLLVGLNTRWKIPIVYFLLDGLEASAKANLVNGCLKMTHDSGARVVSITFDGTATNFAVGRILGAKLEAADLNPWFINPFTGQRVHIFLDVCHMIKLIRNAFHLWKDIMDMDGNMINWIFFEKLVELQEKAGLHAANKLTRRHLNFKSEIMKVKLAVQLFSNSVADALDFCNFHLNLQNFKNSQFTSNFCRILNNTFDILNIRNFLAKNPWSKPFSLENEIQIKNYLKESKSFIRSLRTTNGCNVLYSPRKTGFLGLLISMHSVENLFDDIVKNKNYLNYILTYKLSQDHIELFFSAIRSRGGFNNNPTAAQFEGAYKRLLMHAEISSSSGANCIAQDSTSILSVSSGSKPAIDNLLLDTESLDNDYFVEGDFANCSNYVDDVVEYISGFVSRKAARLVNCSHCCNSLFSAHSASILLNIKNRGGLCKASASVVNVCKCAERVVRLFETLSNNISINRMITTAMSEINTSELFRDLNDHILNHDPLNNHLLQLVQILLKIYFTIRIHSINKKRNECAVRIRHLYSKLILFKNQ